MGRLFAGLGAGVVSEVASCGCGAGCWVELPLVNVGGGDLAIVGGQCESCGGRSSVLVGGAGFGVAGACVGAAVLTPC